MVTVSTFRIIFFLFLSIHMMENSHRHTKPILPIGMNVKVGENTLFVFMVEKIDVNVACSDKIVN